MRLGEDAQDRRAAQTKPTFQPVSEKILPAEPILTVRSRMPSIAISGMWRRASKITCSQTSSHSAIDVVFDAGPGQNFQRFAAVDDAGRVERIVEQRRRACAAKTPLRGRPRRRSTAAASASRIWRRRRRAAPAADRRRTSAGTARLRRPARSARAGRRRAPRSRRRSPSPRFRGRTPGPGSAGSDAAIAARSSGRPSIGGYWFQPSSTASAALARTSRGPGSSGKPWPRLTASRSRARRDIASKTLVPSSAKIEFIGALRCAAFSAAAVG